MEEYILQRIDSSKDSVVGVLFDNKEDFVGTVVESGNIIIQGGYYSSEGVFRSSEDSEEVDWQYKCYGKMMDFPESFNILIRDKDYLFNPF